MGMRRFFPVGLFVLGFVAGAALLGREAAPAHACRIAAFHERNLTGSIENAQVVAVGTLEGPQGDAITLVVEEGLKGAVAGDRLTINNATNFDCDERIEPGRQNYKAGTLVLVFLIPDTLGVAQYKVDRIGWDIFRVAGDVLTPYWGSQLTPLPRIEDVRGAFRTAARTPYDPALEAAPPCRAAWRAKPTDAGQWAGMAEVIVIATVVGERAGATVLRVDESFKGGLYGEITLNDHYLNLNETAHCERTLVNQRAWWPPGRRVAAMLVRDEFGVAEWRGAAQGSAVWSVNDSNFVRYGGIPLLSEVRQATTYAGFQPSLGQSDEGLRRVTVALVAVLAVAVLVMATWLRVRR